MAGFHHRDPLTQGWEKYGPQRSFTMTLFLRPHPTGPKSHLWMRHEKQKRRDNCFIEKIPNQISNTLPREVCK
jgi:hypothetical protein